MDARHRRVAELLVVLVVAGLASLFVVDPLLGSWCRGSASPRWLTSRNATTRVTGFRTSSAAGS